MSDGINDAKRDDQKIFAVEIAAEDLVEALLNTGDKAFYDVNSAAIRYANAILLDAGYELKKVKK